jgi:serine/threonine-protein kinase
VGLAAGAIFAEYRILRLLGSGGMGEVYQAQHPRLPRQYALKILPRDLSADREYRGRFDREADLAASLYHPNIVAVHDRGEYQGQLWIAMDYVDGPDCDRLLRDRHPNGMPAQEALEIVSAVADALDYAHQRGLLHRDVKPANILISQPDSVRRRILLADFGVARRTGDTSRLTETNMVVGTVSYAAPEQLMDKPLDGRTDQYALAITAYQLLTGSTPFQGSTPAVVIGHHLNAPPPPISGRRPELAGLDPVFARALAKNPRDRYARCSDFAEALVPASRLAPPAPVSPVSDSVTRPNPVGEVPRPPLPQTRAMQYPEYPPPPVESAVLPAASAPSSRRWALAFGAIAAIVLFFGGITVYAMWPKDGSTSANRLTPVGPTSHSTSSSNSSSATTSTTTSTTAGAITFEAMRDFVTAYYSELPANPEAAWAKLDAAYQNSAGGLSDYKSFWATLQSVTVVSVSPRNANSVTARLQYVRHDGGVSTEDRWLRMTLVDGVMMIDGSQIA